MVVAWHMTLEWPVIPVLCVTGEETLVNSYVWEAQKLASSTLLHVQLGHTRPAETGTCLSKHMPSVAHVFYAEFHRKKN